APLREHPRRASVVHPAPPRPGSGPGAGVGVGPAGGAAAPAHHHRPLRRGPRHPPSARTDVLLRGQPARGPPPRRAVSRRAHAEVPRVLRGPPPQQEPPPPPLPAHLRPSIPLP